MPRRRRASNGRSSIYQDDRGWNGWVSLGVDQQTGRPVRKHVRGRTEREVLDKVRDLERGRDEGTPDFGDAMTVADWLTHWLELINLSRKPSTYTCHELNCRLHLVPELGQIQLRRLRTEHVERALQRLTDHRERHYGQPLGGHAKASVHRTLRAALNEALRRGRIASNPARHARMERPVEVEVRPLDRDEIKRILDAATGRRNGARYTVALALGLRQSEALGLRWRDVDLEQGTLTVRETLTRRRWRHGCQDPASCGSPRNCPRRTRLAQTDTPKSARGRRTLPLDGRLVEALRAHRRTQASERLAAGELWHDAGWVFANHTGGPLQHRNDYRDWQTLLAEAGARKVRLHDARHTNATMLLMQGVDPRTVMDMLGWSQVSMATRYQHVVPELRRDAARRVGDSIWAEAREDPATG